MFWNTNRCDCCPGRFCIEHLSCSAECKMRQLPDDHQESSDNVEASLILPGYKMSWQNI